MNREEKIIDKAETVAEEIRVFTGLDVRVIEKGLIELDTIAGRMKFNADSQAVMHNVYRFIYHYGSKLRKWGLEKATTESFSPTNQ